VRAPTPAAADGSGQAGPSGGAGQPVQEGAIGNPLLGPQLGESQSGSDAPSGGPADQSNADTPADLVQDLTSRVPDAADLSTDGAPPIAPIPVGIAVAFVSPVGAPDGEAVVGTRSDARVAAAAEVSAPARPVVTEVQTVGPGAPPSMLPWQAGEVAPVRRGRASVLVPWAAEVGPSPAASRGERGERGAAPAPESSLLDAPVPQLAGELGEALAVDAAVLERGLRCFLDRLGSLGLPAATAAGRAPLAWLGRFPPLVLPWLGAAAAAGAALELARRRRPAESTFAGLGESGRWDGALNLTDDDP
jgi:hypothetical protein